MELIPILSLIILVSTISTFILAVGAYVLYKVREARGRAQKAKPPETIPADLVEPTPALTEPRISKTKEKTLFTEERAATMATSDGRPTLFGGTRDRETSATRATFFTQPATSYTEERPVRRNETAESERFTGRRKFQRYTSEIEEKKEERKNKEDNLQWR